MSTQWIKSSTFSPSSWSVYGQPVRTNNDIEVWQNALNRRACSRVQLPFYLLIQLLHRESAVCTVQVRIVFIENLKVWNWSSVTFHYLYVTRLTFYLHVERDSRHPFTRVFLFGYYCWEAHKSTQNFICMLLAWLFTNLSHATIDICLSGF